jgi:hypothetical protein
VFFFISPLPLSQASILWRLQVTLLPVSLHKSLFHSFVLYSFVSFNFLLKLRVEWSATEPRKN